MGLFDKLYPLWIICSVGIGLALGQLNGIDLYADALLLPLLILMLYFTFLQIPFSEMRRSFAHRRFTYTSLWLNFIFTPLLAWLLASLFLSEQPLLWLGFLLLMVTPCTDWYIIFTKLAKGNVALATSILPLNLVLQLLLLPVYLFLFSGTVGMIDFHLVLESIVLALLVPFFLTFVTRHFVIKKGKETWIEKTSAWPTFFLCFAIVAMFASQGRLLFQYFDLFLQLFVPIVAFFVIIFILGRFIGKHLKFKQADTTSLNFTTMARNSPIALAVALTAFPHEPLIAIVLVIGPLLELPILSFFSYSIVLLHQRSQVNGLEQQKCRTRV